jgi:hypothetical protein
MNYLVYIFPVQSGGIRVRIFPKSGKTVSKGLSDQANFKKSGDPPFANLRITGK